METETTIEEWKSRAEASEAELHRLKDQKPIRFHCHNETFAPAYVCSEPGDMSGEYYADPVPQPDVRELVEAFIETTASLAAALSLLEKGGRKAAASDKMFSIMLDDYRGALEKARAALAKYRRQPCSAL